MIIIIIVMYMYICHVFQVACSKCKMCMNSHVLSNPPHANLVDSSRVIVAVLHSVFGSSRQLEKHGIGINENYLLANQHVIILISFMYVYDITSYICTYIGILSNFLKNIST